MRKVITRGLKMVKNRIDFDDLADEFEEMKDGCRRE